MFPDAVTERGRKHIEELAAMHDEGIRTGLLILAHWNRLNGSFLITIQILLLRKPFGAAHPALIGRPFPFPGIRPLLILNQETSYVPRDAPCRGKSGRRGLLCVLELAENRDIAVGSLGKYIFPRLLCLCRICKKKIS